MSASLRWTQADLAEFGKRKQGDIVDTVIGIDPGKNTGFAVFDKKLGKMAVVKSADFWGVFGMVQTYPVNSTKVVIEVANTLKVWSEGKSGISLSKIKTASKVGANVGGVRREAQLMSEGLKRLGYMVKEVHPRGKVDADKFKRVTGYTGRTNEHSRDAGMMAFTG